MPMRLSSSVNVYLTVNMVDNHQSEGGEWRDGFQTYWKFTEKLLFKPVQKYYTVYNQVAYDDFA